MQSEWAESHAITTIFLSWTIVVLAWLSACPCRLDQLYGFGAVSSSFILRCYLYTTYLSMLCSQHIHIIYRYIVYGFDQEKSLFLSILVRFLWIIQGLQANVLIKNLVYKSYLRKTKEVLLLISTLYPCFGDFQNDLTLLLQNKFTKYLQHYLPRNSMPRV